MAKCNTKKTINLKNILAKKATSLLYGNDFHLYSEDEEINIYLKRFQKAARLQQELRRLEKHLSKHGRAIVGFSFRKDGLPRLFIANEHLYSKASKIGVEEVSATFTLRTKIDDKMFFITYFFDTEKMTTVVKDENGDEVSIQGYNSKVPKHMQLEGSGTWYHNYGICPVMEFENLPGDTFSEDYIGSTPDSKDADVLQDQVNNIIDKMEYELEANQSRIIAKLTPQEKIELANSGYRGLLKKYFISVGTMETATGESGIKIIKGEPELERYSKALNTTIQHYFNFAGYDWNIDENNQKTTYGTYLSSAKDIRTTREKKRQRTQDITLLIDKILFAKGFMKNIYDEGNYIFEIKDNILMDELKHSEKLLNEYKMGVVARSKVVAELNGHLTEAEAQKLILKIDKEMEDSPFKKDTSYISEDEEGNQYEGKTPYEADFIKNQGGKLRKK